MAGPSKDIPASQLWLKLSSAERPSKLVDFPRKGEDGEPVGQLSIRVLTQEEQMICTAAAEEVARKHIKEAKKDEHLSYDRLFTDAVCVEVLYRACRDPGDSNQPAFPTPQDIRRTLTTEECAALFRHYMTIQVELGPTVIGMSDGELEAWIDRLVEGGSAFPFDLLSSDLQRVLVMYMAHQLRNSPTDSSSAGSQPEKTSPDDSEKPPINESS